MQTGVCHDKKKGKINYKISLSHLENSHNSFIKPLYVAVLQAHSLKTNIAGLEH